MEQQTALKALQTGVNVFLTGEAGTGKSYIINQFVDWLKEKGVRYAVTATTGIAASQIGGVTIHSWSGIGIKKKLQQKDIDHIVYSDYLADRIRETEVLIIDEISMLDATSFEDLDKVLRAVKGIEKPFGDIQLVVVGDFFQLPPVGREGKEVRFAFESELWQWSRFTTCYLTEQYRQNDNILLSILTAIRNKQVGEDHLKVLSNCKLGDIPETKLFTHNVDVDSLNNKKLREIKEKPHTYTMTSGGNMQLVNTLRKQCLSPESLDLKVGAVVMFTRNNPDAGYVNGTTGKVVSFKNGMPVVELANKKTVCPEVAKWVLESRKGNEGWIKQIPLKLAWAITIHKSQGMSLDRAFIDLTKVFEYGQGYVAISRMTSLYGMHLEGVSENTFRMHPKVVKQDEVFRWQSENPIYTVEIPRSWVVRLRNKEIDQAVEKELSRPF